MFFSGTYKIMVLGFEDSFAFAKSHSVNKNRILFYNPLTYMTFEHHNFVRWILKAFCVSFCIEIFVGVMMSVIFVNILCH